MDKVKGVLVALRGLEWYTIMFLFIGTITYTFKTQIVRVIDMEFTNKDIVVSNIENDIAIDEALSSLMIDTKADRAYIIRFHNGVTYYNGTHKSKMSCDYEVVNNGVTSEAEGFQDVPTALYSRWIKDILEMNMFEPYVDNMSDLRIKHLLGRQGVKALAVTPYYRNGKVFALIGIDYVRPTTEEDFKRWNVEKDSKKIWFKNRTDEIGNLLL